VTSVSAPSGWRHERCESSSDSVASFSGLYSIKKTKSARVSRRRRVHETRKQSLHILVVARGAGIHDFNIAAHSLEEARNVRIHARCFVCIVLCSRVFDQLGDVVVEERCQQNFVLVVETPATPPHHV